MTGVASDRVARLALVPALPLTSRLLSRPGPGARDYLIASLDGAVLMEFSTVGIDGRSCDETAIGHVITWSEAHRGKFVVAWVPGSGHDPVALCVADRGIGRYLVAPESASADSMYGTQLDAPAARLAFGEVA